MEPVKTRHPQLLYESKLYKLLQGGTGIPHVRHVCGVHVCLSFHELLMSHCILSLLTTREAASFIISVDSVCLSVRR